MAGAERSAPILEVRAAGNTISGPAVRYGERGRLRAEWFEPGAFVSRESPLTLDAFHDPAWSIAAEPVLQVEDGPKALEVRATLDDVPLGLPGSGGLHLIRNRTLTGLSVSFHPLKERTEGGVRVIEQAHLVGIGAVPRPEYPGSLIEVRQMEEAWLTASIPYGSPLQCECQGDGLEVVSLDVLSLAEMVAGPGEVLAVAGDFSKVLGSKHRGTLLLEEADDGVRVGLTAQSAAGREVAENAAVAPTYVRPLIDVDASDYTDAEGVRQFQRADVSALLVKPTTNSRGWREANVSYFDYFPEQRPEIRRIPTWL